MSRFGGGHWRVKGRFTYSTVVIMNGNTRLLQCIDVKNTFCYAITIWFNRARSEIHEGIKRLMRSRLEQFFSVGPNRDSKGESTLDGFLTSGSAAALRQTA